ncbi:MAG: SufE family protein [Chitinophagaceae bacterium]|nr:SufE family protein [Chitinophagaceae bacterium]
MDINKIQDKIIAEFEHLAEAASKFSYFRHIRKLSNGPSQLDPVEKNDENLVAGCRKKVWVTAKIDNGRIYFKADSDNMVTRGMLNLILKVYSGQTVSEITNADLYFLHEIRLFNYLSAARLKDLLSIVQRLKSLAIFQHINFAPKTSSQ